MYCVLPAAVDVVVVVVVWLPHSRCVGGGTAPWGSRRAGS